MKSTSDWRERRNAIRLTNEYTVETLVVADADMVQYHGAEAAQRFILTVMNMLSDSLYLPKDITIKCFFETEIASFRPGKLHWALLWLVFMTYAFSFLEKTWIQMILKPMINEVYNMFQHQSLGIKVSIRVTKLVLLRNRPWKKRKMEELRICG
ncbi:hypothetical protein llap_16156 [Limosa lapponica baueri]|uniref:Uncharacterized protein n=1 Tax=Limosa lapponica baueri TaxID=1758121 RepID=A0A2I0TIA1_LIMLA|nr:hypothetical protein llap_16156 [Limosa lapponica baueri]